MRRQQRTEGAALTAQHRKRYMAPVFEEACLALVYTAHDGDQPVLTINADSEV